MTLTSSQIPVWPMDESSIYEALLRDQALAAFEYLGDGDFRLLGNHPPRFCADLFGDHLDLADTMRLGEMSPFLEFFLAEAQVAWDSESDQRAESGLWVEKTSSGRELGLEATALRILGRRILLIQNPQDRYVRQVEMLQTAHKASLVHERLQREIQKK